MGGIITQLLSHRHDTQMRELQQRSEWLRTTAADANLDEPTRLYAATELNKLGVKMDNHAAKKPQVMQQGAAHQNILSQYLAGNPNVPEPMAAEAHGALAKMLPDHVQDSFQHFGENALPSLGASPPQAPPTPQLAMQPGSAASPSVQATQPPPQPPPAPQPQQQMAPPPQAAQPSPVTASTVTQPNQSATASMPPSQVGSAPSAGFAIPAQMQPPPSADAGGFRFHPFTPAEQGQREVEKTLPGAFQKMQLAQMQRQMLEQQADQLGITDPVQRANFLSNHPVTYAPVTSLGPGHVAIDRTGKTLATGGPQLQSVGPGGQLVSVPTGGMQPPPGADGSAPGAQGNGAQVLASPPPLLTPSQRAANAMYAAKNGIKAEDMSPADFAKAESEFKEASMSPTERAAAENAKARTESQLATQASARLTAEVNRKVASKRLSQLDVLDQYDDNALDTMANQVLAGQKVTFPMGTGGNQVKAEVMNRAAEIAKQSGNTAAAVPAMTAAIKADSLALGNLEKQTTTIEGFANNTDRNFQLALKMGNRVDRSNSPVLNRWLLKLKGQYAGDPNVTAFEAALNTAATDWAKVTTGQTSGQAVTDSARQKYDQLVSAALSGKSLRNLYTEVVMPELDNRKRSLEGERQKLIGRISGKSPMNAPPAATGTVQMRAPNGQTMPVPADQVEHYKAKGAVVVQ